MKMKHQAILVSLAALILPGIVCAQGGQSPAIPVGTLSANMSLAKVGASPTLTWDITHPAAILDVVTPNTDDTFTPKTRVNMSVKVIGADYVYGYDSRGRPIYKPVQIEVRVGGGGWTRIFSNTHNNVNPSTVIFTRQVEANQMVEFRFRGSEDSRYKDWLPYRLGPDLMVAMMIHGQTPPTYAPYLSPTGVQSYLTPYMAANGTMNLGPRDLIYICELTNTNTNASGFDMQDLVMVVTCNEVN
jgi:hypothetical protein